MSKRAKDVLGKPIVSAATGEKLGVVADLLLNDSSHQLEGLVVEHGGTFNKSEDILPLTAVQSIGPDVVVSRSDELVGTSEWKGRGAERRPGKGDRVAADDAATRQTVRADFGADTGRPVTSDPDDRGL